MAAARGRKFCKSSGPLEQISGSAPETFHTELVNITRTCKYHQKYKQLSADYKYITLA